VSLLEGCAAADPLPPPAPVGGLDDGRIENHEIFIANPAAKIVGREERRNLGHGEEGALQRLEAYVY
jgi:hypothetical protein